jgi:hypothetical protein
MCQNCLANTRLVSYFEHTNSSSSDRQALLSPLHYPCLGGPRPSPLTGDLPSISKAAAERASSMFFKFVEESVE